MEAESRLLAEQNIKHTGLIGDMYEGLTAELLERAIPSRLDLRVASGVIENLEGKQSRQIDCMLVEGAGTPIPHTGKMKYPLGQVLAVVEVKKRLYYDDLEDAYQNLFSVTDLIELRSVAGEAIRSPFELITGLEWPGLAGIPAMSVHHQQVHHTLVWEVMLPVRMVLAYDGFKTERTLRTKFWKLIGDNIGVKGFAPAWLPNLVACGDRSLVKLNAMPYATSRTDRWDFYGSYSGNPLLLLLELVFTRLTFTHKLSVEVFGEDLTGESVNRFLAGSAIDKAGAVGWVVEQIPLKGQSKPNAEYDWEPYVLDQAEYVLIYELCSGREVDVTEPELLAFLGERGRTIEDIGESLRDKRLATVRDNRLVLLTHKCGCAIVPPGQYVAAEDKSGRFSRWLKRRAEKVVKATIV
jgi:hypothetical protein